ncbi:MAG: hypothetical protein AB7F59_10220 [Bdellovibrionales bacterium]
MKILISFMVLIAAQMSYACPVLEGADLSDGEDESPIYTKGERIPVSLTQAEFNKVPVYASTGNDYESCQGALVLQKLEIKKTKQVFYALLSTEDICDGGNSSGALFSADLKTLIGDIGDSFISCRKTPVRLDLSKK